MRAAATLYPLAAAADLGLVLQEYNLIICYLKGYFADIQPTLYDYNMDSILK